jgi:tripartite-type tricarboxylate transporter receptor subunit TctC
MKSFRWLLMAVCGLWCAGMGVVVPAQAAAWPVKPVRVIVPFAAGGSTDIVARILCARLTEALGQQFVVDNRAGAGGSVGADITQRASPDGYTVIIVATSYATNAALYSMPFDPVKDITPIALLHSGPWILAVNMAVKANNLKELIELARAQPGTLNFGSSGIGGGTHLASELLMQLTKTKMVHVPYKGDAPAVVDLLGGQIQFIISSAPALLPHLKAGKLRAFGVTTEKRSADLPDIPAIGEIVPGYETSPWNGMWGPPGIPKDVVARMNQALGKILAQPEVQERLRAEGREATHTSPQEFARIIERDVTKWKKVVKEGNIKVQ